jgi:hypothetical protein
MMLDPVGTELNAPLLVSGYIVLCLFSLGMKLKECEYRLNAALEVIALIKL